MEKRVRIGLLGCGVVGGGVVEALTVNSNALVERVGASFEVTRIAVQDLNRERGPRVNPELVCDDWRQVVTDPNVDIVVEVIGGIEPAKSAITLALQSGKDVVTANKELMAIHGETLQALAKRLNRALLCEGSVLGGVPAIHALHTYFVANRIGRIRGIVNGTNNYILTKMTEAGEGFIEALAQAQRLGYAEADPTMDVAGYDALYKLRILSRLAFDVEIASHVDLTGVTEVSAEDIEYAHDLGCRIRHIVEARVDAETGSLSAAVGPQLVPANDPLYHISGADNFLEVEGDIVGRIGLSGPGAGALPTASAVVEDVVKVVKGSEFRLRQSRQIVAQSLRHGSFLVRRRFGFGPAGNEPALAWRSDLGAAQVKYLGVKGTNAEAWYVRGCDLGALECLRVVSSSLDGDFAVYPVSGEGILRPANVAKADDVGLALAK
ncbi:homoserine dehydrogenase [Alicyclobacillus ferrooxydans]|uniref:homoserine dehydrogenase n=1 Tax=Alicyclobacillus ferrooxydans TaxID=471514 RepID=UPI0006D5B772|nr:homoserine dehydrogenase [Alicyclobacillus ferrooxydans]